MTTLIEDSPRNLVRWIMMAVKLGLARGGVITPFATPRVAKSYRRSATDMAGELRGIGAETWFDPMTHVLQMAGVGDFRFYDEYDLWGGPRGDLTTSANRQAHVERVFRLQTQLQAPRLGPTVLLHHGESETSELALELAREAITQDSSAWLTIAGTGPFWASDAALDSHVGALAQLQPAGWFVAVARPLTSLPVEATRNEVHGLCRTVRALSEYAPIHLSHGDLAGLPAVAACAASVGSGWDQRQRCLGFGNFSARAPSTDGGAWYKRVTFQGLLGALKYPEAEKLSRADAALAGRLGGVPPDAVQEIFHHHLSALRELVDGVNAAADPEARFRFLDAAYTTASAEWPNVIALSGSELGDADWIEQHAEGLRAYGAGEGW